MTNTFISLLFAAAGAAAVQHVIPGASSYIYRSDHNGPASLIQLGGHPYQLQQAYVPPLPVLQPIIKTYNSAPAASPYIAAKPIVVEDVGDSGGYGGIVQQEFGKGGGSDYNQHHRSAHGDKESKGYSSKGHIAKGASGHHGKKYKEGYFRENDGVESSYHDEAGAHGKHHAAGEHYKGGDHGLKKHHSKGEEVTGYHKVFNKDEFKKDHDFYDVADSSGHYKKHGYEKKNHDSEEGGQKNAGSSNSGQDIQDYSNAGYYNKGHSDEAETGDSKEEGHETYENNEKHYGKEGASNHEKKYSDADDDNDDDEYEDDDE